MISMVVKNKYFLKVLRKMIPKFRNTNFITALWSYYPDSNIPYLMNDDYLDDKISSVYIKNKPVNAGGIIIDDVEIGVSLDSISEKSAVFRQIGNKVIVGIDLSNCKILTNTSIIHQIACYYLGKYLLPRYFLSSKFMDVFNLFVGKLDSDSKFVDKYHTYVDYARKVNCSNKEVMSNSLADSLITAIDNIVTKDLASSNSLSDKYEYLDKLKIVYNGDYRQYQYFNNGVIKTDRGITFSCGTLRVVFDILLNTINKGLYDCKLRLSDDMISRIKSKGTYINDTVLPLFYIDDVKFDSKYKIKTHKVHMMVVSKDGNISYTGKVFSLNDIDLQAWVSKTFKKTQTVDKFTMFDIK